LVRFIFPAPVVELTAKEKKEALRKRRADMAAAPKRRADRKLKEAETLKEKDREERKIRLAKQAEYIAAHK
jgi:hypothetical protein